MMDYVKDQKNVLSNIFGEIYKNKAVLDGIFKDDPKINTSFYVEPLLNESYEIL